jgi:small conductance mechanosensitive channel
MASLLSSNLLLKMVTKIIELSLIIAAARLALLVGERVMRRVIHHSQRFSSLTRERRTWTLMAMMRSVLKYLLITVTFLIILGRLGVSAASLITGSAIAGLAVTFGAQNVIRDLFSGIALLIEDAFSIGDRVTVAGVTGEVIEMGLRVMKLRGDNGVIHLVPYGAIQVVSNHTRTPAAVTATPEASSAMDSVSPAPPPEMDEFSGSG